MFAKIIIQFGLMLIFVMSSLQCVSASDINIDRDALIDSAIMEVERKFAAIQEKEVSQTSSQEKLYAFKKASPEALAQGNAYLKYENMVTQAEHNIIKNQWHATMQSSSSSATETMLLDLFNSQGNLLSEQELAKIFKNSDCTNTIQAPTDCHLTNKQKYQTPDGTCNNIELYLTWGAANTPLRRLLPAAYEDGVSRPRGFKQSQLSAPEVFSSPNPSPRVVSTTIITDLPDEDTVHTHMLMQWGQFTDHDITAVPEYENCPKTCKVSSDIERRCFPFAVPNEDNEIEVTHANSITCHEFRRSFGACPQDGQDTRAPRQQLNSITHFIDGSNVYSHSAENLNLIRNLSSNAGMLKTGSPAIVGGSTRALLPDAERDSFITCPQYSFSNPCFLAGDFRANEQSSLSVMHTLWLREHNRIAQYLKDNNPTFSSEKIFQVARRIVVGEMQKITFKDYLPILLGDVYSSLIPDYTYYNEHVNPSIPNAFATAAFRFGHSQIQPFFERLDDDYNPIAAGHLSLVDAFFNTNHVRVYGTDPLLRGLLVKPARKVDEYLNSILTNKLFADDKESHGMDLASLNIQRGRDHGLPTYTVWKEWAKEECDLVSQFKHQDIESQLLKMYGQLKNVDLFVGGLAEEPVRNGVVGAVFSCIIAKTFLALRDGDRFYFENSNPIRAVFSQEQREELAKISLSRVICDNTDITKLPRNAFLANQARVSCTSIPSMDLSLWNEPNVPPPVLPDLCYIKVRSNNERYRYDSSSRRDGDYFYKTYYTYRSSSGDDCLKIKCPGSGGEATVTFYVGIVGNNDCGPTRNPNLPESLKKIPGSYTYVTRSHYVQVVNSYAFTSGENGLYSSLATCQSSSSLALNYDCAKQLATAEENEASHSASPGGPEDQFGQSLHESRNTLSAKLLSLMEKELEVIEALEEPEMVRALDEPDIVKTLESQLEMIAKD